MVQFAFFFSIAFAIVAWGTLVVQFAWPALRDKSRADALRPVLVLHAFRFVGLSFLVPGVVSPDLPHAFAIDAAFGDIVAAVLALAALATLRRPSGLILAWIFNLWGLADLFNAFYQARTSGLDPGQLGATYFIPTFAVPLLLVTHALAFRILWRREARTGQSVLVA
jgi:hypothetical protein